MFPFFEARDARCPKRTRRWFWGLFKTQGYHDVELLSAKPWGASEWYLYEVLLKCKACGAHLRRTGITETELLAAGVIKKGHTHNG